MSDAETYADATDPTEEAEPKSSRAWLATIAEAQKAFQTYHDKADNIDKQYADLERLAGIADREFQMFWANIAVLAPSIYSRPPVPVVVPRFKDRRPLARQASELLERTATVALEIEDIDSVMRLVRDDMTITARGCVWLRYVAKGSKDAPSEGDLQERICIDHVDRKDFLHGWARKWKEVPWVAKRSWLTKDEMRDRFEPFSSEAYRDCSYAGRKDDKEAASVDENGDKIQKCAVWEIWSKTDNCVVWVSENCEVLLDESDPPHLTLDGFFPCPQPAYATVQRRSLVPVPDMLFYKGQLEEINELTNRIAALSQAVRIKGFYAAGAGELSDAVEAAMKANDDNAILKPISNWALLGNGARDAVLWLPISDIVAAIVQIIQIRKQVIDDVYQITGLSDIMRGSTVASETLGAQQLKSQYGSVRVRDRQSELVRIARDIVRIGAEIMAENFAKKTFLDMSQLEMPSDADIAKQVKGIEAKAKQASETVAEKAKALAGQVDAKMQEIKSSPQAQQLAQAHSDQAKQALQQAQQQVQQAQQALQQEATQIGQQAVAEIDKLKATVTIEAVMKFLRDQRLRPFVLDIETDSTIAPDEDAAKQRATEWVQSMGALLAQAIPAVQAMPQVAPLLADVIRFASSQFRVGREMEQSVEEFTEQMKQLAQQPPKPDPAAGQAEADQKAQEADMMMKGQAHQADMQAKGQAAQLDAQSKQLDAGLKQQDAQHKAALATLDIQAKQQAAQLAAQQATVAMQNDQAIAQAKIADIAAARDTANQTHAMDVQLKALDIEHKRATIDHVRVQSAAAAQNAMVKTQAAEQAAASNGSGM